jgi:hypothetical protein
MAISNNKMLLQRPYTYTHNNELLFVLSVFTRKSSRFSLFLLGCFLALIVSCISRNNIQSKVASVKYTSLQNTRHFIDIKVDKFIGQSLRLKKNVDPASTENDIQIRQAQDATISTSSATITSVTYTLLTRLLHSISIVNTSLIHNSPLQIASFSILFRMVIVPNAP